MLESEENYMGQEFKPRIDLEEPVDGDKDHKMKSAKDMVEAGKQVNENQRGEPYVNHEGLKRVFRQKNSRDYDNYEEKAVKTINKNADEDISPYPQTSDQQPYTEMETDNAP